MKQQNFGHLGRAAAFTGLAALMIAGGIVLLLRTTQTRAADAHAPPGTADR